MGLGLWKSGWCWGRLKYEFVIVGLVLGLVRSLCLCVVVWSLGLLEFV